MKPRASHLRHQRLVGQRQPRIHVKKKQNIFYFIPVENSWVNSYYNMKLKKTSNACNVVDYTSAVHTDMKKKLYFIPIENLSDGCLHNSLNKKIVSSVYSEMCGAKCRCELRSSIKTHQLTNFPPAYSQLIYLFTAGHYIDYYLTIFQSA